MIMKKTATCFVSLELCLLALILAFLHLGCEEAKNLRGLTIEPSYVELSGGSNTVILSVSGITNNTLALPVVWQVTNPGLGAITARSGSSAVYARRAAVGDNTVIARDQYNNEGYATVSQR